MYIPLEENFSGSCSPSFVEYSLSPTDAGITPVLRYGGVIPMESPRGDQSSAFMKQLIYHIINRLMDEWVVSRVGLL